MSRTTNWDNVYAVTVEIEAEKADSAKERYFPIKIVGAGIDTIVFDVSTLFSAPSCRVDRLLDFTPDIPVGMRGIGFAIVMDSSRLGESGKRTQELFEGLTRSVNLQAQKSGARVPRIFVDKSLAPYLVLYVIDRNNIHLLGEYARVAYEFLASFFEQTPEWKKTFAVIHVIPGPS